MYRCSVCNLAVALVWSDPTGEPEKIRACQHTDAPIIAQASASMVARVKLN